MSVPFDPQEGGNQGSEIPLYLLEHPRYKVLQALGEGGMGQVFLAEHKLMGRRVAIKTIHRAYVEDSDFADRFLREIRATSKLCHPNVVVAHDAEATPESAFLVMEYLEGQDLHAMIRNTGALDQETACEYAYQAALAINHAHRRGVIHRDIKPGNLFVMSDESNTGPGVVKVVDFGLAKILGDMLFSTPVGFSMGTVGFMSPEQSKDARAVAINADIFSLGRTLYFLLSGRNPYPDGPSSAAIEAAGGDPVIPLAEICPQVSNDVRLVVQKMSARHSKDRFQSCEDVLAALAPLRRHKRVNMFQGIRKWMPQLHRKRRRQ